MDPAAVTAAGRESPAGAGSGGQATYNKMLSNGPTTAFGGSSTSSATSSQYLNPDYVQPLCTSLDAKNSPLALLAQTCSSIGRDSSSTSSSSNKLNLTSNNGKDSSASVASATSHSHGRDLIGTGTSGHFRSLSPPPPKQSASRTSKSADVGGSRRTAGEHRSSTTSPPSRSSGGGASAACRRTPNSRRATAADEIMGSPSIGRSSGAAADRRSALSNDAALRYSSDHDRLVPAHSMHSPLIPPPPPSSSSSSSGSSSSAGCHDLKSSPLLPAGFPSPAAVALHQHLQSAGTLRFQQEAAALQAAALAAAAAAAVSSYPPPPTSLLYPPTSTGMDPLSVYSAGLQAAAAALYPRLKDSGLCPPPATSAADQCTIPGCTQCVHATAAAGSNSRHQAPLPPTTGHFPAGLYAGLFGGNGAAGLFPGCSPPTSRASAAGSYGCSWLLPGGEFCGRRFLSSDELHQHLRTHVVEAAAAAATSAASSDLSAATDASSPAGAGALAHLLPGAAGFGCFPPPTVAPSVSFTSSAAALFDAARLSSAAALAPFSSSLSPSSLLAFHHQQQQEQQQSRHHQGRLSPSSLFRYHPYKSPSLLAAGPAGVSPFGGAVGGLGSGGGGPPASALAAAAFFSSSPYAWFGGSQQMGAAAGP